MFGVSLKDRKRSVDLYSLLGVQSVDEVIRRGRLRWFGHVERKSGDDLVSALFFYLFICCMAPLVDLKRHLLNVLNLIQFSL